MCFSPLNTKKQLFHMGLFCVYPVFHWGDIVWTMLSKVGVWEKRYKERDGHIGYRNLYNDKIRTSTCHKIVFLKIKLLGEVNTTFIQKSRLGIDSYKTKS